MKLPRVERSEFDSQASMGTSSCEIDSCDIESYMKVRNISESVKFRLLKNHFKPGPTYCFRFATGCRFQHKWLHQFTPWLVYSEVAKAGFCLPCALFASSIKGVDPGVLVTRPLINLTKALEILGKHKVKQYHLMAITKCDEFLHVMQGQQPSIAQHLNKSVAETIANN